jgi:hypothetical protein
MKRFWITVCLFSGGATLVYGQLREPVPIAAVGNQPTDPVAAAEPATAEQRDAAQPAVEESSGLRQQFVERMQRKAALMSEEELKAAISSTDIDIREREAAQRLLEIKTLLTEFASEYESTKAAQEARRMFSDGAFRPL